MLETGFFIIRETYCSLDSGPPRYDPVWKKRREQHAQRHSRTSHTRIFESSGTQQSNSKLRKIELVREDITHMLFGGRWGGALEDKIKWNK